MGENKSRKRPLEKLVLGNTYILIATVFWGVNYAFTKALIPAWMSATGVTAVRLVGGCILFWLASFFVKNEQLAKDDMIRAFFGGFVGLFCCIYCFVLALKYGSPIDISIICTLPPAWVIVIETLFLHRHPRWTEYAGIIISFIGAALVIITGSHGSCVASNFLLGDLFAVGCSVGFALYLVILSKPTDKYNPVILLRWVFLYAAIPMLFILLIPGMQEMPILHTSRLVPWLEISFILFGPTFMAYLLTQPAVRDIGSVLVSLYQYLTPVVATICAILMGVDKLRWMQVVAMLIIVAGMLLTNFGHRSHNYK